MKKRYGIIVLAAILLAALVGCGPTVDFVGSPTSGPPPLEVNFTDQSSGNPKSWEWYFGDGATSSQENPLHTYDSLGSYTVTLVVSNAFGEDDLIREDYIVVEEGEYKKIIEDSISFQWKAEGANLHVILSAPTTGWVGVGFDPTSQMKDANFIIGYVTASGVQIRDDYGISETNHQSDVSLGGTDNVTGKQGSESEGITEIRFSIPLDSGDQFDRPLVAGQTYTLILAYGPNDADDFETKHTKIVITSIKI